MVHLLLQNYVVLNICQLLSKHLPSLVYMPYSLAQLKQEIML